MEIVPEGSERPLSRCQGATFAAKQITKKEKHAKKQSLSAQIEDVMRDRSSTGGGKSRLE